MGVLISNNTILTDKDCNVEPVYSTVSLGSNVDDNNIEGEFSVESYQEFQSADQHYKILGIELWKLLTINYL